MGKYMVGGQHTTLNKANKTSNSLRTTVPSSIIKQFDLIEGDSLTWKLFAKKEELLILIEPVKKK